MRTLVLYFSLTGTTRTVAETIARELGADIEEIGCTRYARGFWGFWRAATDSWRHRRPDIAPLTHDPARYDLVILAGPIWAFHPAPPLLALVERERARLPKAAVVLTHGGSAGERSLAEMQVVLGREPVAALVVQEQEVKAGQLEPVLSPFLAALERKRAA